MYTYIETSSCTSLYTILICRLSLSKDREKMELTEEKTKQKNLKKEIFILFLFENNCLLSAMSLNTSMIQLMQCKTIPLLSTTSSFAPKPPKYVFFSLHVDQDLVQVPH